jgi:hypothetical protein
MNERLPEQPSEGRRERAIREDMVSIQLGLAQVQRSFEHLRGVVGNDSSIIPDGLKANMLPALADIEGQVGELQRFLAPTGEQ